MHAILWDWDRFWYLAFFPDVKPKEGVEVPDLFSAESTLSRLLEDSYNRDAARNLLATRWQPPGQLPQNGKMLLLDLMGRLERRECRLLMGAPRKTRTAGRYKPKAVQEAWETWEFVALKHPDDEEGGPAVAPPKAKPAVEVPVLRFASAGEPESLPRFSGGADRDPVPAFGGGSESGLSLRSAQGADGGPAFAFAGESEGTGNLEYSFSVNSRKK